MRLPNWFACPVPDGLCSVRDRKVSRRLLPGTGRTVDWFRGRGAPSYSSRNGVCS